MQGHRPPESKVHTNRDFLPLEIVEIPQLQNLFQSRVFDILVDRSADFSLSPRKSVDLVQYLTLQAQSSTFLENAALSSL